MMNGSKFSYRPVFRTWWSRWLILAGAGLFLYFLLDVTFSLIYKNQLLFESYTGYLYTMLGTLLGGEGFRYLTLRLNKKYSWEDHFAKRLFLETLEAILLSLWISLGIRWLLILILFRTSYILFSDEMIITLLGVTVAVGFVLLDLGVHLVRQWRYSLVEIERFRKESAESRFETLRSQVNPHFLFNNLNTLSSLIYENPERAGHFIRDMADVYRYILETRDMDTVSLAKELDFIRSYLFLLEIRYENRLAVDWDIPGTISERRIVPATLQLLVENVIKHNVIAKKKPLRIRIFLDDQEYLVISNDLQKKDITGNSSGFGLNSIASRYKYLTERPVVIEDNGQSFIVKIPLI